jgi:uncharacterized membrane protein YkoI
MTATRPQTAGRQQSCGKNRGRLHLAAALLLLCGTGLVQAQPDRAPGRPPQNNLLQERVIDSGDDEARTRISRRDASDLAREKFPGRVLSIRLDNRHWRVRMDQDGTVFNVLVDANSGAVARSAD